MFNVTPRPPLPPGKTRYPLYRRLGGSHSQSWQVGNISPPPGFDHRTVQPVASRRTDWVIPAPLHKLVSPVFELYVQLPLDTLEIDSSLYGHQMYWTDRWQDVVVLHCVCVMCTRHLAQRHHTHTQTLARVRSACHATCNFPRNSPTARGSSVKCWRNEIKCGAAAAAAAAANSTNYSTYLDDMIYIYIYILTYLLHGAESFLSSWLACS